MKKITLYFTVILLAITGVLAQTPNQFKYQAVLRNADGTTMAEENVTVDISILQASANGTSVFTEQHNVTTSVQGLINLNIGSVSDLSIVDFSANTYFIEISINSTILGTSQLLSVPYAMVAKTAENVFSGNYNDLTNQPVNATTSTDGFLISIDKAKLDNLSNVNITAGTGISTSGTYPALTIASSHTHYLGETYLDGIIFTLYIGSDGQQHGLIVSITETEARWQNAGVVVNADRAEDGLYNTGLMTNSPAKEWVESLGAGWYLPSIDELSLLWHNRYYVNKTLRMNAQTLLATTGITAIYWSSNEANTTFAFNFNFTNGHVTSSGAKAYSYRVRGIRTF